MRIFRNVYQIASPVADRDLFQYLLVGDDIVLLETGASHTPNDTIASFLVWKTLQENPEGVTLRAFMDECGPILGGWRLSNQWLLMYPLHGDLLFSEQRDLAVKRCSKEKVRSKIAS
jgi:hypothetical protein